MSSIPIIFQFIALRSKSPGSLVASGGSEVRVELFRATASPTALTEPGEYYRHYPTIYEGGESIFGINLML